jgi:SNF2 family DNA or RNA helicase
MFQDTGNGITHSLQLRPYQQLAIEFLDAHKRCNLYAGMGLGKTVTTLTHLAKSAELPALVIAPLRVARSVWPEEVAQWPHLARLTVQPVLGTSDERRAALKKRADIYTINYDNIPWLTTLCDSSWPFRTVVADESTRLKGFRLNQGTKRASALAQVAHARVKNWINLTGLPAPNGLMDLWGQQWFVDGGLALGRSFTAFRNRWFYPSPRGGQWVDWLPLPNAQREIEARMRATTMAIDARDWFDLKEPIVEDIWVELPPGARAKYRQMADDFFTQLEHGLVQAPNAAVKSGKLLQLANGAAYHEDGSWSWVHDEKIEAVRSIVEEAAGAPVLVAYQFRSDLERLRKAFPRSRVLDRADKTAEADWNAGRIGVLFAHPKSAGHGLNLQHGGNILVYFGQDWNLEDYDQILERIGPTRQMQSGYDRNVFVYHVLARNTLDAAVRARRDAKTSVMETLLAAMKEPA